MKSLQQHVYDYLLVYRSVYTVISWFILLYNDKFLINNAQQMIKCELYTNIPIKCIFFIYKYVLLSS